MAATERLQLGCRHLRRRRTGKDTFDGDVRYHTPPTDVFFKARFRHNEDDARNQLRIFETVSTRRCQRRVAVSAVEYSSFNDRSRECGIRRKIHQSS